MTLNCSHGGACWALEEGNNAISSLVFAYRPLLTPPQACPYLCREKYAFVGPFQPCTRKPDSLVCGPATHDMEHNTHHGPQRDGAGPGAPSCAVWSHIRSVGT